MAEILDSYTWRGKYIYKGEIDESPEARANGVAVLSPIRNNKNNTCFYRSLCSTCDAQARLLTRSEPFEDRFSVKGILRLERKWLSIKLPHPRKVHHCLGYFSGKGGPNLPMQPENGVQKFKISGFQVFPNEGTLVIPYVKRVVQNFSPVIGSLKLRFDYFSGVDEVYLGEKEKITMETLHAVQRPPYVKSPVTRTPTPPPLTPSPPKEGEKGTQPKTDEEVKEGEKKKKEKEQEEMKTAEEEKEQEEMKTAEEEKKAEEIPDQRIRVTAHAVCIVGFRIANDKYGIPHDCFIVQDNYGSKFRDGGFSVIPINMFDRFFIAKLVKK